MIDKENKKKSKQRIRFWQSIQAKILVPFLLLIILTGGVVASVSYNFSSKTTEKQMTNNMEMQMDSLNDTFELFFDNVTNTLDRISDNPLVKDHQSGKKKDLFRYLKETGENDEMILAIYGGFEETGEMIDFPDDDLGDDYDPRERSWYEEAVEAEGSIIWTDPYEDAGTGETVVTAAKSYYDEEQKLIGVVGADISVDTLLKTVDNVKIGETGYAFLIDDAGTYLAHPDDNLIGEDATQESYFEQIDAGNEQGTLNDTSEDQDRIVAYAKTPATGWILASTVQHQEFKNEARSVLMPIAITVLIVLIFAIIISFIITRRITNPITSVMQHMKLIADGDLTKKPFEPKTKDEIAQLMLSTNNMSQSMHNVLSQIGQVVNTVSRHSETLTQSVSEVRSGADQIATTMEELASGSEMQANRTSELSNTMATLTAKIQSTSENGEQITNSSHSVLHMTDEGSKLMIDSEKQMEKVDHIVSDSVTKMQKLDNQSQEISKLVSVVEDIAGQTNLLALNAAIEAARAGESGKGFAVVADEVRKLAEQVSNSVADITGIVGNIQHESNLVTESLHEGYKEVKKGTEQIQSTGEKFEGIKSAVSSVAENIKITSNSLNEIRLNSQQMNDSIQDIAAVTEESSAGVEETSAASQQTSSSMEEVASSSGELSNLADDLNKVLQQFKL